MSPISKIVVVGSSNTDMIVRAANIPRPGETVIGSEFRMGGGGKGANQAVAAARAGGDVAFIARVGDDIFGRQAVEGFRRDGIETRFVFKNKRAASGVALIVVDNHGENSIAVASGANAKLTPADIEKAKGVIAAADILLLQLETPLETISRAAKLACANGVPVILNPAPARSLDQKMLGLVTILTPNEIETEILTGIKIKSRTDMAKAARKLMVRGVKAVLITLGARGVFVADGKTRTIMPACKVKAVDTTAAGDVFNGALAVALAEGRALLDAARFANAAAALSVTKWGAQPSAPKRKDIERFMTK
jgi:ribokinase